MTGSILRPVSDPVNRLREVRLEENMTQQALAQAAGLAIRTVQHAEAGTSACSLATARRIARALGRTVDEVFPEVAA